METIILSLVVLFLVYDKRSNIKNLLIRLKYKIKIPIEKLYQQIGKLSTFAKFTNYDYSSSFGFTFTGNYISGLNITGNMTMNPTTGSLVIYNGTSWQPVSPSSLGSFSKQDFDNLKQDNIQLKTELADLKTKINKYFGGII